MKQLVGSVLVTFDVVFDKASEHGGRVLKAEDVARSLSRRNLNIDQR